MRDRIFKIERTLERQRITQTASIDQDVIGIARHGASVDLQVLFVRGGLLIGRKDFFWLDSTDATDEELVRSAVEQFYNKEGQPPRELLIPVDIPDADLLARGCPINGAKPCACWLRNAAPNINSSSSRRKMPPQHWPIICAMRSWIGKPARNCNACCV